MGEISSIEMEIENAKCHCDVHDTGMAVSAHPKFDVYASSARVHRSVNNRRDHKTDLERVVHSSKICPISVCTHNMGA